MTQPNATVENIVSTEGLFPCPMCALNSKVAVHASGKSFVVKCGGCGLTTGTYHHPDFAASMWNSLLAGRDAPVSETRELGPHDLRRYPGALGLHPATTDLVHRFACALAAKLQVAEEKYGYSDGWLDSDWMDECRKKLREHVEKGDPRDVAAYCAFLWHHKERT